MNIIELLSSFSNVIIAVSILMGVVYLVFMGNRIYAQIRRAQYLNSAIEEREFYSKYDDNRLSLERQIADLNIKLTRSFEKFEDVNHLVIDGQKRIRVLSDNALDPDSFLETLSINSRTLEIDRNLVFVLTPFHPSEQRTYSAIVEGLSEFGIRVVRGDEESAKGDVLSHILRQMLKARLVIANINTRNPNVMYELGIAHALGKDVVMISNTDSELPFDVNSRRILFYADHNELVQNLRRELARKMFSLILFDVERGFGNSPFVAR